MRTFTIDQARLDRYLVASDAGFAAARELNGKILNLASDRGRLRNLVKRRDIEFPNQPDHSETERAQIEKITAEIGRLTPLRDEAGELAQHNGRIASNCREYAESRGMQFID